MTNIINFGTLRRTHTGRQTLYRAGFPNWQLLADRRFDVKAGKLLPVERCRRGGETRTRLT